MRRFACCRILIYYIKNYLLYKACLLRWSYLMGDSEMNEIKAKLKELAALCIDKEVVFHCDGLSEAFMYSAYTTDSKGIIRYISKVSEIAADWKADSLARLDEVIALVENYNG